MKKLISLILCLLLCLTLGVSCKEPDEDDSESSLVEAQVYSIGSPAGYYHYTRYEHQSTKDNNKYDKCVLLYTYEEYCEFFQGIGKTPQFSEEGFDKYYVLVVRTNTKYPVLGYRNLQMDKRGEVWIEYNKLYIEKPSDFRISSDGRIQRRPISVQFSENSSKPLTVYDVILVKKESVDFTITEKTIFCVRVLYHYIIDSSYYK